MIYNADEIYQIGIEIEKNGQAFYLAAAESTDDEDAKKLFEELAGWEETHVKIFSDLKAGLPAELKDESMGDDDDIRGRYLKAAADTHVFMANKDMTGLVSECDGPASVLEVALRFEKDSVVVYSAMKALIPADLGKDTVDKLIDEEVSHVAIIQGKLRAFSGE